MSNTRCMITRFVVYGLIGLCAEVLWTGAHSLFKRDFKLRANTSVWMFFIYGAAVLFEPLVRVAQAYPVWVRGVIYVVCIFGIEYFAGILMKKIKLCPWDYSGAKLNIHGVIRLDYAPAWFALGLVFEFLYLRMVY